MITMAMALAKVIRAVLSSVCIRWMEQLSILHGLRPREIPFRFLYILFATIINITTTMLYLNKAEVNCFIVSLSTTNMCHPHGPPNFLKGLIDRAAFGVYRVKDM